MQQQLLQQALLMQQVAQQPPMFPGHPHPALLAAPPIEPIVSGNLPPGFDSSTCCSVYVGHIHLQVTDTLLQEVFQSIGPVEGCKLIRKEKKLVKRMHVKTILKTTHSLPLFMSGIFLMRLTRDKGFGFVRYITHDEAALAIQMGNGQLIGGRQIKCSWGSKPTPPGTASAPLPPPAPAPFPRGMSTADLLFLPADPSSEQDGRR